MDISLVKYNTKHHKLNLLHFACSCQSESGLLNVAFNETQEHFDLCFLGWSELFSDSISDRANDCPEGRGTDDLVPILRCTCTNILYSVAHYKTKNQSSAVVNSRKAGEQSGNTKMIKSLWPQTQSFF